MASPSAVNGGQDNAMTEIALALAMGFFSLLVLTLVSMGNGQTGTQSKDALASVELARDVKQSNGAVQPADEDLFVVLWKGAFHDRDGKPINVASLPDAGSRRVILVVDPESPLSLVMKARALVPAENVVVANMTRDWKQSMQNRERVK